MKSRLDRLHRLNGPPGEPTVTLLSVPGRPTLTLQALGEWCERTGVADYGTARALVMSVFQHTRHLAGAESCLQAVEAIDRHIVAEGLEAGWETTCRDVDPRDPGRRDVWAPGADGVWRWRWADEVADPVEQT